MVIISVLLLQLPDFLLILKLSLFGNLNTIGIIQNEGFIFISETSSWL